MLYGVVFQPVFTDREGFHLMIVPGMSKDALEAYVKETGDKSARIVDLNSWKPDVNIVGISTTPAP